MHAFANSRFAMVQVGVQLEAPFTMSALERNDSATSSSELPRQGAVPQAVAEYEAARAAEQMQTLVEMDTMLEQVCYFAQSRR